MEYIRRYAGEDFVHRVGIIPYAGGDFVAGEVVIASYQNPSGEYWNGSAWQAGYIPVTMTELTGNAHEIGHHEHTIPTVNLPAGEYNFNWRCSLSSGGTATGDGQLTVAAAMSGGSGETVIRSGTLAAATATTATLDGSAPANNLLKLNVLYIATGTGAGQARVISGGVGLVQTIDGAWAVTPDNTSTYKIFPFGARTPEMYSRLNTSTILLNNGSAVGTDIELIEGDDYSGDNAKTVQATYSGESLVGATCVLRAVPTVTYASDDGGEADIGPVSITSFDVADGVLTMAIPFAASDTEGKHTHPPDDRINYRYQVEFTVGGSRIHSVLGTLTIMRKVA